MMRRGWTLLEVIVVIFLVLVLVAILLPVLFEARRAGKASVCLSNLSQIMKSTLLYVQDYDECFPVGFYRSGDCVRSVWGLLNPYVRESRIWLCPLDGLPIDLGYLRDGRYLGADLCERDMRFISYQPNWCLMVNGFTYPDVGVVSLARVPYHAETVVWFDGVLGSDGSSRFEPIAWIDPRHGGTKNVPSLVVSGQESRFHGRVHVAFLDGHVKGFFALLRADMRRIGDIVHVYARPVAVDGRVVPVWLVQGTLYWGSATFFGWPVRPVGDGSNRFVFGCYPRPNYCEEWH